MAKDEIAIERLSDAYDKRMSAYGFGAVMYDDTDYRRWPGNGARLLIPGVTDAWGNLTDGGDSGE